MTDIQLSKKVHVVTEPKGSSQSTVALAILSHPVLMRSISHATNSTEHGPS